MKRREFLGIAGKSIIAAAVAPAIVKAEPITPISTFDLASGQDATAISQDEGVKIQSSLNVYVSDYRSLTIGQNRFEP